MPDCRMVVRQIQYQLMPYGNYFQRLRVPEGKQGLNVDPGLTILAAFLVGAFMRAFVEHLGAESAKAIIAHFRRLVSRKGKRLPTQDEVTDSLAQLQEVLQTVVPPMLPQDVEEKMTLGFAYIRSALIEYGLPTYRAEALMVRIESVVGEYVTNIRGEKNV